MHRCIALVTLPLLLGACCGLQIDYDSVGYFSTDSAPGIRQRQGFYLRVFFSSPTNLARVSADSGLMSVLEIPGEPPIRMLGSVYRDLRSPVWSDQLAYQRWREPERYDFYAEMELDVRLFAGVPSSGSLIVHSPGVLMRCPLSNVVTVPRSDLVESLSN
jgi:hypothetical protein